MSHAARMWSILSALLAGASSVPVVADAQIWHALHMEVLFPPAMVPFADGTRLVYELHLTNFARTPVLLHRLSILDGETGAVLGNIDGAALDASTAVVSGPPASTGPRIAPGMRGVIYLDVPVANAPRRLRHRIEFDVLGGADVEHARAEGAETPVSTRSVPVLGPPLRGGPWVAVYAPQLARGHRRVVYAVNGRARIPGRFAIDWMKGSATGTSLPDSIGSPARDDGFGSEVLAVADAIVAVTRDDFPDARSATPLTLQDATGNYIALDLGDGRFAIYEHLKAGLLVRPGDRVRRGQVIARLGATGQANRAHLHFHLSDGISPLGSEGLPFALEHATVLGAYESFAAFSSGSPWTALTARRPAEESPFFPSPNTVIMFPPSFR